MSSFPAIADSHCHLADPKFSGDIESVIARAHQARVGTLVTVGAIGSIEADRLSVEIAEKHPGVHAAVGVHPHNAKDCDDERLAQLRALAGSPKVVAIGESGLDFHYMHSPPEAQESSLRRHLQLAAALDKPIVIHCRAAERHLASIIRETGMPPRGGVVHCFTGDAETAGEFLTLGFHISFSGILTFKNARAVRDAAAIVPNERLMVETDAPYLAPEPYRGKRNEPAYVLRTFEVLAALRKSEPIALAGVIAANTSRLFALLHP